MKKFFFLLSMLLLLGSWQDAKADVSNLRSEDGWTKLIAMPTDDWADYYYVIADYHQELMMQLGMGAKQEAAYNTLWLQKPVDPLSDQTVLFTAEKTVSASTGTTYWLLRCVAFPGFFLQTESAKPWYYRTHDNGGGEKSWGRLEIVPKTVDGDFQYFYMKNGKLTDGDYNLGAWETTLDPTQYPAGTEVALNKAAAKQGHFLIYAIRKADYAALQQARLEAATKDEPQDVTWYLRDPNLSFSNSNSCWTVKSGTFGVGGLTNNLCGEFFNCTFDISQTLTGLPNGVYQVKAQGFYRVGGGTNSPEKAATARAAGNEVINAEFYANSTSQPFPSVFDNHCTTNRGTDYVSSTGYNINGTTYYVPTTMARASAWFSEDVYEADVMQIVVSDGTLQLGARKNVADSQDWSIFDNFRLYYLGANHSAEQEAALEALLPYEEALLNMPDPVFEQILKDAREAILNATTSEEIAAALNMVKEAYKWYVLKTEVYVSRKATYTQIAAQHVREGVTFNTDAADEANESVTSVDAAAQALTLLGKSLVSYMNNFDEEFNMTSLIVNPSFETDSPFGWSYQTGGGDTGARDNSNSIYTMSNADGRRIFNTYITSETTVYDHFVLQTIDYMPVGDYQLSAVMGGNQNNAQLRLIANDYQTENIICKDKTVGVSAVLDFDVATAGNLTVGARSDHWFKADNFKLKYKPFKAPDSWEDVDLATINLENEKVSAFLSEADYRRMGATSVVADYATGVYDKPAAVEIRWPELTGAVSTLTLTVSDKADFSGTDTETRTISLEPSAIKYNLKNCTPSRTYYYKVEADGVQITNGHFETDGMVRMIATEGGSNVRDLGGRITLDGRRVKYGRLYRGGEMHLGAETNMTAADLQEMARLGITAELDLRNLSQVGGTTPTASAVAGAKYLFVNLTESEETLCTNASNRNKVRDAIHFIAEQLKSSNVYFHCIWGADRTGAIAFFVENILNCSIEDMYKDFELTSFSKAGHRAANWHEGLTLQSKIVYIQEHYEGATLQEQVVAYLKDCGVTDADIASIRNELLEDDANAYNSRLASLKAELNAIITMAGATWQPDGITSIEALKETYNAAMNALTTEVDLTGLLMNAAFTTGTNDWVVRGMVAHGGDSNKCVEVFEKIGSVRQTLDNMPAGTYILKAQGYQNNGGSVDASYQAFVDGTASITSYIMLNNEQQTLLNIFEDAQNMTVLSGDDAHPALGVYAPNSLSGAAKFFQKKGLYWNVVNGTLGDIGSLTLGAAQVATAERDWTALDNFHLYYRGAAYNATAEIVLNDEADVVLPEMDSRMTISSESNRTLVADTWNTICLPFNMTADMMAEAGITEACSLDSYDKNAQIINFASVNEMKAGIPYLVRVNADWNVSSVGEVLIRAKQPLKVQKTGITFKGFYNPDDEISKCYLVSDNTFVYAAEPTPISGMRGTITLSGSNVPESLTIAVGSTDDIETCHTATTARAIYDLQGRKLSQLQKGLNIIIMDGKPVKMLMK